MKKLPVLFIVFVSFYSCHRSEPIKADPSKIDIGITDSLFSTILREQRKILVHVPSSDSFHARKKYPVIYLLDGDIHFSSVVSMIEHLSSAEVCPEMIVVGIPNTNRTRDLTPTKPERSDDTTEITGGAENFTKFLEAELIPYIDRSYPTTTHRVIVGHSLGGLFVVNTLLNHSNLFSNYVAIDPSLWWDNKKLLHQTEGRFKGEKYKNKSLYVAVANTMRPGMKLDELAADTTDVTRHMRAILEFIKVTKANSDSSLAFESKYYDNDSHISVPLIATYDATRFFYAWYEMKHARDYFIDPAATPIDKIISDIKSHCRELSAKMGYEFLPPEVSIDDLGNYFLDMKQGDYTFRLFQMNLDNYPASANTHASMGNYYLYKKDTVNAIAYYEKALSIAEVPGITEKLDKLQHPRL